MKYTFPFSSSTPVNPIVNKWKGAIPEAYHDFTSLYGFLLHLVSWNYENGKIEGDANPFYKIVELLEADKLYYSDLLALKKYYHIDIIRYLLENNLAEAYVNYPCYCPDDLRKALSVRNNRTGRYVLAKILSYSI